MTVRVDDTAALPANEFPPITAALRGEPAIRVHITLEVLLYVALAVLSLTLRTAQLGAAPLNDGEAHQALAALRTVDSQVPGEDLVAPSPLTFVLNVVSFAFGGASNTAARLPVALGGVLLTLAPALWRRYLNPLPPLILSLLLTISPVALMASRTMEPVIWSALLAVVGPWLVLRYVETRRETWAVLATVAAGALILLADPAGVLMLLALVFGLVFAWLTEDAGDEQKLGAALRELWAGWPWQNGLLALGIVVVVSSTLFFLLPSGLTTVGQALAEGIRDFTRRPVGTPLAFPLWAALRYELGIVLFGLLASYRAVRVGGMFERALVGWFLAGVVWSLVYAGASAAYALWITLPLAVLVALAVTRWITEKADMMWNVPHWSIPLHAVITFALWVGVGISVVLLGKYLLLELPYGIDDLGALVRKLVAGVYSERPGTADAPPEVVTVQDVPVYAYVLRYIQRWLLQTSMLLLLVAVMFFLVGSIWGARAAARGLALGTLAFLLTFSFSQGGRAAFDGIGQKAGDPREFWYPDPVTNDVHELRATLREMSLRENGSPHLMRITAQVPQDGALAWALRGFPKTEFVDGVGPEVDTPAVVMPMVFPDPLLGADYLGKELIVRRAWDSATLSWRDAIMWFYRSESQQKPVPGQVYMTWIRKDVYGVEQVR